jgi:BirA family biotin operon repressor/biotin-[acetyl-CoA-carboxylase] ligase
VIVGIGVNVMQRALPPELGDVATSIAIEQGKTDREALFVRVRDGVARWRHRLEREGFAAVRARWLALATTPGRAVTVDGVTGVARGLDDDGALVIERDGRIVRVLAGDVAERA